MPSPLTITVITVDHHRVAVRCGRAKQAAPNKE